MILKFTFK